MRPNAAETVIERFFEAAAAPELWPEALHELAQACGSEGAAAHTSSGLNTFGTVGSAGVLELHDEFVKHWSAPELNSHRSRGIELLKRGWRGALTEQDCFRPEELARDPFQQELFQRSGFSSFAGLILAKDSGTTLSLSIIRRTDQGSYSASEIAFINQLAHRLRAASALALRVGLDSTRHLADAFAIDGKPMALLGQGGHVLHMNAEFAKHLGQGLDIRAGQLVSPDPKAEKTLAAEVSRAVNGGSVTRPLLPVVLPRADSRPLLVHIVPVAGRARDLMRLVCAVVTLTDVQAPVSAGMAPLLERVFDLSGSEAALAVQIMSGKTLPQISSVWGIPHETIRSRLKTIFEKTGTARQTELVSLLSRFLG